MRVLRMQMNMSDSDSRYEDSIGIIMFAKVVEVVDDKN